MGLSAATISLGVQGMDSKDPFEVRRLRSEERVPEPCLQTVRSYVEKTRSWKNTDYLVESADSLRRGRAFAVVNKHDDFRTIVEGAKSFHLELNMTCDEVVVELAYQ